MVFAVEYPVPAGTTSYTTWANAQTGLSHENPSVMAGNYTFTDAPLLIGGHCAIIRGTADNTVDYQSSNKDNGLRIGATGSTFSSGTPDSLTITGGATLKTNARVQVGWEGDGYLYVGEGSKIIKDGDVGRLIIGDSRDSHGNGKGKAEFVNSKDNVVHQLVVGYYADAELRMTDSSMTVDDYFRMNESGSGTTSLLSLKNSTLTVEQIALRFVDVSGGTATINLENSTLQHNGSETVFLAYGRGAKATMNMVSSTITTSQLLRLGTHWDNKTAFGNGLMNVIGSENQISVGTLTAGSPASRLSFLADTTGSYSQIKLTNGGDFTEGDLITDNIVMPGFAQYAGFLFSDSHTLISTKSGTIKSVNGTSGVFDLTNSGTSIVATLTAGKEFQSSEGTGMRTGWKTISGDSQSMELVKLTLAGGDDAAYDTLVTAMNAGAVDGVNYGKINFVRNGNTIEYKALTNYAGKSIVGWDFEAVAPAGVMVTDVNHSATSFDYIDATAGTFEYNTWAKEVGASHYTPVRMSGGTFTASDARMQVFGHSLYVTGEGTILDSQSWDEGNHGLQIGGTGSRFDSLVDKVIVSDNAHVTSNGRVQVGMYGDGELLLTDSTMKLKRHLVIGDSRLAPGQGNGRVVVNNSQVDSEEWSSLTLGYQADGELILENNSTMSIQNNFYIAENTDRSNIRGTLHVRGGSKLEIGGNIILGQSTDSLGVVCLDNGTLIANNSKGGETILGDNVNTSAELHIGNNSTFTSRKPFSLGKNGTGLMQVIGDNKVTVTSLAINNQAGSRLNFFADNTGLTNITANGNVDLKEKIRVGLAGGAVSLGKNSYTLISSSGTISGVPTSQDDLWILSSDGKVVTGTLNSAFELKNTPLNKGWIYLNSDAESPQNFSARLVLSGLQDGEIYEFMDWLNSGDYLGELAEVSTSLLQAEVEEGSDDTLLVSQILNELGETYFAFDFSGFNPNVLLQSVTLQGQPGVPEPTTCILMLLGTLWIIREKRRRI